ncbi:MAG: tRNA lysidine(34) synthetase TilS, partial [Rhizobacter sp.]
SAARRSNVLRAWWKRQMGSGAPAALVARLLDELPTRRNARWPSEAGELSVYRGVLRCAAPLSASAPARETTLSIQRPGAYALPDWSGALHVEAVPDMGVPLAWLAHLVLRERKGAEQFQAGIARPPRSLKKQFQDAGVPAWERTGPLLYSGGQLVFVPGLGLDARVIGLPGQVLVTLRWEPSGRPRRAR